MKINSILKICITLCLSGAAFGFVAHKEQSPQALGFHQARVDDEALLELAVDQLKEGFRLGRVDLINRVLAANFGQQVNSAVKGDAESLTAENKNDSFDLTKIGNLPKLEIDDLQRSIDDNKAFLSGILRDTGSNVQLTFEKQQQQWKLIASKGLFDQVKQNRLSNLPKQSTSEDYHHLYTEAAKAQSSIARKPVSAQHGIDKLTRSVTEEKLDRALFQKPYAGVLFSSVTQLDEVPFFQSSYVQLITDPAWNRVVYGNYNGWLKSFHGNGASALKSPRGIDRDADGNIYIADAGNNRIVVLKLEGAGEAPQLTFQYAFGSELLALPYDVAWDDAGTPLHGADDILWALDTDNHRVIGFATGAGKAEVRYIFGAQGNGDDMFLSPKSIAVSRFNGAADGFLYIADTGNRRIVKLSTLDEQVRWVDSYSHKQESLFTSVSVDHWGNVYATDRSYREALKLSPTLQLLAIASGDQNQLIDPVNFQVVFGRVNIQSENKSYWAGYDQAFTIEKWSENSGMARFQLDLDIKNFSLALNRKLNDMVVSAMLTDNADVDLQVIRESDGSVVRQLPVGWSIAGDKEILWNRRADNGEQIEPGNYRIQISAKSAYAKSPVLKTSEPFYLPLYYHEDSGADRASDPHLVQGVPDYILGSQPSQSIATHPSEVIYRFTNLKKTVNYEVMVEFNHQGNNLKQSIAVDEMSLTDDLEISVGLSTIDWLSIPESAYLDDGAIDVRIIKKDGDNASVSQLWIRQADYNPADAPLTTDSNEVTPDSYSLSQNYPNPFNPTTNITFVAPDHGQHVSLRVFNTLGQTVRTLVDANMTAGEHVVTWDGRDQSGRQSASGIYFYQLRAGKLNQTKKMILMK